MYTLVERKYLGIDKNLRHLFDDSKPVRIYKVNSFMFFIANNLPVSDAYSCVGQTRFSRCYKGIFLNDTLKSIFNVTDNSEFKVYEHEGKLAVTILKLE